MNIIKQHIEKKLFNKVQHMFYCFIISADATTRLVLAMIGKMLVRHYVYTFMAWTSFSAERLLEKVFTDLWLHERSVQLHN